MSSSIFKKSLFLFIILVITGSYARSQSARLLGEIDISLQKESLKSNFYMTAISQEGINFTFSLYGDIKVKLFSVNGKEYKIDKVESECYNCKTYNTLLERPLNATDTVNISTTLKFKSYPKGYKNDFKGLIINNYGILRASEQTMWYPMINSSKNNLSPFLKTEYSYELKASCADCKNIYIGSGKPKKSGNTFTSRTPSKNIMLIAGDFGWTETESTIYVNIKDENQIAYLDSIFASIKNYYEQVSGITMPQKFTFAHLPSGSPTWGGFMTYPTIVKVTKEPNTRGIEGYLSHEVAHYIFGKYYESSSTLFWFFLESTAEYFSFKYQLNSDPSFLKNHYPKLKDHSAFLKLDEVTNFEQISSPYRYFIGAFQLLAIENKIGEETMMELLKEVFRLLGMANIKSDGYKLFISAMKNINLDLTMIREIETDILLNIKLTEYHFLENN